MLAAGQCSDLELLLSCPCLAAQIFQHAQLSSDTHCIMAWHHRGSCDPARCQYLEADGPGQQPGVSCIGFNDRDAGAIDRESELMKDPSVRAAHRLGICP